MPFIPVPNTCLLALRLQVPDGLCVNTLSFEGAAAWSPTTMEDLADAIADLWEEQLSLIFTSAGQLAEIYVLSLESDSAPSFLKSYNIPGIDGGDRLPPNVAAVVTFRTALRGRSYRGRNYLGGIAESKCAGSTLTTGYTTQALAGYGLINAAVSGINSAVHVVVSRQHNNVPLTTGVTTPVTSYDMNTRPDTQRGRLPN